MLVTIADIKTYMDISLTLRQEDAAELIIAGLQSELETYLNRPVELQTFEEEEYRLDSTYAGVPMGTFLSTNANTYNSSFSESNKNMGVTLWSAPPPAVYLRNTPISEITEITVTPLFGNERVLRPEIDYIKRSYGFDYYYGNPDDLLKVTYTAGLDGASIPLLKLTILRAVSREMQNLHDDVVSVKDLTTRNVAPLITGFLDTELAALRKLRKLRI
jgi:hypothetical protein